MKISIIASAHHRGLCVALAIAFLVQLGLAANSQGQDQNGKQVASATSESSEDYRKLLLSIAKSYTLTVSGEAVDGLELFQQPIFSWSNPQRQSDGGAIFMWTQSGRPFATIGIWKMEFPGRNGFEFQSFADTPVEGHSVALPTWKANEGAVKYRAIADTREPSTNANVRLRQMREIARNRFSAHIDPNVDGGEELRLLSTPLYRYEKKPKDVVDGAMFAFAQDTDPELMLILEARQGNGSENVRWYFAMAPATSHGIEGKFDGETVLRLDLTTSSRAGGTFQLYFWTNDDVLEIAR